MTGKIPGIKEIQAYINDRDILGLRGARVELASARNHLIYRLEKDGRVFALRMINSESYRAGEWASMAEEYAILQAIEPTGLGPRVHYLDEGFSLPFLIQEFVTATCFNDLKPLHSGRQVYLKEMAAAIARLNSCDLNPRRFPFMRKYVQNGYENSFSSWFFRLADSMRRAPRRDVLRWVFRILPIVFRVKRILFFPAVMLSSSGFYFHFDGAHCGNTYWRDGRVIFLDWQKVSYRNDPTYTLVRFATSVGENGEVMEAVWETLLQSYLAVQLVPNFRELAWARLLERQTSDLVWVLWDYTRRGDRRQVDDATSVVRRYEAMSRRVRLKQ